MAGIHPEVRIGMAEMFAAMGGTVLSSVPVESPLTPYQKGARCPFNTKCRKVNTSDCTGDCRAYKNIQNLAAIKDSYT